METSQKCKVSLTREVLKSYNEHHTKQLEIITYFLWETARTEVILLATIQDMKPALSTNY